VFSPAEQERLASKAAKILAVKTRNAAADVSALEREIDDLVYALYGLRRKKSTSWKAAQPNENYRVATTR
jgi:hypothetical protein